MCNHEEIAGERMATYWDRVVSGEPVIADGHEPEDTQIITTLHALYHPQRPSAAFRRHLRDELLQSARASGTVPVVSVLTLHDPWVPSVASLSTQNNQPGRLTGQARAVTQRWSWLTPIGVSALAVLLLAGGFVGTTHWMDRTEGTAQLTTLSAPLQDQVPAWSFVRTITGDPDPLESPSGFAVAADGQIYVIDRTRDQIRVLDAAGQPVIAWGESGSGPGQFWFSVSSWGDLAIAPDGSLVVIDPANSLIHRYSPDGTLRRTWGGLGDDPGKVLDPQGVAVDGDGRIYVADYTNHRVQVFDDEGQVLAIWDGTKGGGTPLAGPVDVAIAPDGIVWVTDDILHRVIGFQPDGMVAASFGGIGDQPGQLHSPWGIAVDDAGLIYVAEHANDRVQVFTQEGTSVALLETPGSGAGSLDKPTYLAFGPDGSLYVSNEGNRELQEFRITTGETDPS